MSQPPDGRAVTSDLKGDFILQSREHLSTFEQALLALEKAQSHEEVGGHIDRSLRAIHSLKGDAGFLGYATLRTLAHAMESLLEGFRGGSNALPVAVVEALLSARDHLAALVEDLDRSHAADIGHALARLSAADTAMWPSPMELDIDLTAQSDAASGRLGAFFNRLAGLGTLQAQRLIVLGNLAQALPAGPVRLAAQLCPTVSQEVLDRVLGKSAKGDAEQARSLSDTATNVGAAAIPSSASSEYIYRLHVDLAAWSRSTATPLVALLTKLARAGKLVDQRLDIGSQDLFVGIVEGPVILRGEFRSEFSSSQLQQQLGLPTSAIGEHPDPPVVESASVVEVRILQNNEAELRPMTDSLIKLLAANRTGQAAPAAPASESERLSSLRVNVELLDRLMTLVGELTLVRNQSLLVFDQEEGTPRAIIQRLNSVTSDLQDTVLRTRMQPVGNLFGKFPRMVRDLARQLGKQVEVVTVGGEVELDKTVLEQLSDPLTHLIRNSIDHGIESSEERVAKGKSPTGKITLSATPADGQVQIEIRDDGRGIDPATIMAKALALRLKTEAELERMAPKEIFSLILLPGFSTAKKVTEVSGRGVGMDVVKTNVDQLEGSLTIDSTLGAGTSMLLRVPLTLAIIPCLIVDVGDQRYAVPQRELEEVVCLHPGGKGSIEQAFDSEVFRLRNRLLPIVRFREVLERTQPFTAETKAELLRKHKPSDRDPNLIEYIVVLRSGGRRFGLLVDEVRGTQEVVVKPMHATLKRLGVFAGATLMGDGRVALIPNVDGIVEHANCFGSEQRARDATDVHDPAEMHRVLIFECGPREQFALPLVQIRRIESIDASRIETVGNQEFVTLDGVATRVVRLDKILNVTPCPQQQTTMYLVLPKFVPEPMGILISRIVDTDSLTIDLQRASVSDECVLGTAIVRGRLSLFLDIQYLREHVFGKPAATTQQHAAPSGNRRVLLIDDTPFFRETVKRYLEAEGINVTTATDGQDGLKKLSSGEFDLIVCDIEMPNLDGWGFAQAARERGCRLPLLALTSLSKVEHEVRAKSCGFDEYQEKLDHDQLLRTVNRLLNVERPGVA
jgi:two-component system, chemotaxis family, sensor kinase CheA